MTELYQSDATLDALSGTSDAGQGVLFPTVYERGYYTSFYKMLSRLLLVAARAGDLRVYKDGTLTFGVRAGLYMNGPTAVAYAGAAAQALTNTATNYIYLTASGTLTVNTTGFPAAGTTPHIPLASIVCAGGTYAHADIVDYRGRALLACVTGLTPAVQNALTLLCPSLEIAAAAEAADVRRITIQAKDAGGTNLAARVRVRLWISASDYGTPSATGNTYGLVTGTALATRTADADYEVISDAAGLLAFDLTITGAASRYVMAEVDGRIYSSGQLDWAA